METFDGERALEELRWLERLALRLVSDPHEAGDLSQEALLAAHRAGTLPPERRRPWLARTLRNLASKAARGRGRRPGYEREGARSEALPSADDLVARAEQQERLLALVRGLPEGQRTPLLLRYYEEQPVAAIAERLGLPVRTVHTRLHRGLKELRERMDAEHPEGRAGWMAALGVGLRLPAPDAPATLESAGASAPAGVSVSALAGGAVLLVLGIAAVRGVWGRNDGSESTDDAPGTEATARARDAQLDAPAAGGRRPVDEPAPLNAASAAAGTPLSVFVLDWDGRPVPDAALVGQPLEGVWFSDADWRPLGVNVGVPRALGATSDADGRVVLEPTQDDTLFTAEAAGLVTAVAGVWRSAFAPAPEALPRTADAARGAFDPFVVVAPAQPLTFEVVDGLGSAPPEVEALVVLDAQVLARFDGALGTAHALHWEGDYADGRVHFAAVPWLEEAELLVHVPGYALQRRRVRDLGPIVRVDDPAALRAEGRLVDGSGAPLQGTVYTASGREAEVDAGGWFALELEPTARALWGVAQGRAPRAFPLALGAPAPGSVVDLGDLALDAEGAVIAGRLIDPRGVPLAGRLVWIEDPTTLAAVGGAVVLEALAAGETPLRHAQRTDGAGRFRFEGLRRDRAYTLRTLDERTAQWEDSDPLEAGEEHLLVFPKAPLLERLAGRVLDDEGAPVAGVRVTVRGPGLGFGESHVYQHGATAETDAAGRFELLGVPPAGVELDVTHPALVDAASPVELRPSGADWTVPRLARLQVRAPQAPGLSELELLGADGRPRPVQEPSGLGRREVLRATLRGGSTAVLEIPCDVRTLVLYEDGREVRRVPFHPRPGAFLRQSL